MMRIVDVETFVLNNRRALVKITTDEGVHGWGEPILENWARATEAAVHRMREHLIGADPFRITHLWQLMTRAGFYRGGPVMGSAVAGIDQALWDIKGKALGVPVHELLGGAVRDRVRVYAHGGGEERAGDPDRVRTLIAGGFSFVKVAPPGPREHLDRPRAIEALIDDLTELRELVGPDVDIAIDAHGRFSAANARRVLALLEPLLLAFVEEPVVPEHSELIGQVVSATTIPIATGERLYSRAEFRPVLTQGVAVVQPDPSHAGGITEVLRIAALAEMHGAVLAPHCPLGPVALAACLQLDLAVPNFLAQEYTVDLRPGVDDAEILVDTAPLIPRDGFIERLTAPGLGIEVDEEAVRARVATGELAPCSPVWAQADGSFAEW